MVAASTSAGSIAVAKPTTAMASMLPKTTGQ